MRQATERSTSMPGQLAFVNRVGETGATLAPGAVVMGSGTVLFVNGVFSLDATHYHPANTKIDEACVNLSGDTTLDNLDIEGAGYGILDVSGSLTIAKTFRWNGTLQGSGQTIVQGKTTIGDGQDAWLKGHRLTLQGGAQYGQDPSTTAALYTASIFMTDKATLTNAAGSTFDCRCNGSIHNQGGDASRFVNAGTLKKSYGSNTATIAVEPRQYRRRCGRQRHIRTCGSLAR